MYESQPQPESRDDYEAALTQGQPWPPTDAAELAALDRMTDNAEADYAFACGWEPFSGLTPSEFLASLGDVSWSERCGSQFEAEVA